ncbi:hypothetical protein SAMN05216315_1075 [Nitrosospira sp. Nsp18]|uniref:hypothetical protein n=1 Tax=Nitrosospira sp. Nsp18 TaxID=1855334 RepID=UPI000887909A|nr:hypothetical protein [Nitrosospira sp. Nsp18]SDA16033.1 hypothetical protein SAMN05216315_1075 [Nitrosospira sp. Nsp18]
MEEYEPEFTITITYDNFLTRFDLDEILSWIDTLIEDELLSRWHPHLCLPSFYLFPLRKASELSFIGIRSTDKGALTLNVAFSTAVAVYVGRRFKPSVGKSFLADQLDLTGGVANGVIEPVMTRINEWATQYVPKQRELGGQVTDIQVKRCHVKRKNGNSETV